MLIKLVMTLALVALIVRVLVPSVAALASTGSSAPFEIDQQAIYAPVVSTIALLFASRAMIKLGARDRAQLVVLAY